MIYYAFQTMSILLFILTKCEFSMNNPSSPPVQVGINSQSITGYNLSTPDSIVILPKALHEISGLTTLDHHSFACIQDERGTLFIYNLDLDQITKQISFYSSGDFEDIAKVGKAFYILRSDATLFEIEDVEAPDIKTISFGLNIPAYDNEGLCYDKENNRLLIASKGNSGKGEAFKNQREVYAFDLKTKTLVETPAFTFDEKQLKQFATDQKIDLPVKVKKSGKTVPDIKFRPSAIGIHPITKQLFLISGPDQLFFIFSPLGVIEHLEPLDPELFNQPEGLTFSENGDLFITNEGQEKQPTLLRFNYKKG